MRVIEDVRAIFEALFDGMLLASFTAVWVPVVKPVSVMYSVVKELPRLSLIAVVTFIL